MRKILSSYFWWTYERGSIHFDILVTLILLFMFVSPHYINFGDRPVEPFAFRGSEVLVREAGRLNGNSRFTYEIRTDQPGGPTVNQTEEERRAAILRIVQPISGDVTIERVEPLFDHGKIVAYNAWVVR